MLEGLRASSVYGTSDYIPQMRHEGYAGKSTTGSYYGHGPLKISVHNPGATHSNDPREAQNTEKITDTSGKNFWRAKRYVKGELGSFQCAAVATSLGEDEACLPAWTKKTDNFEQRPLGPIEGVSRTHEQNRACSRSFIIKG
jgi:hypothetical protein